MGLAQEMSHLVKSKQKMEAQLRNQQMIMQKSQAQWVRTQARIDAGILREKIDKTNDRINTLTEKRYLIQKEKEREKKKDEELLRIKRDRTDMRTFFSDKAQSKQRKRELLQKIDRKYSSLGNCPDDEPLLMAYRKLIGVVVKETEVNRMSKVSLHNANN